MKSHTFNHSSSTLVPSISGDKGDTIQWSLKNCKGNKYDLLLSRSDGASSYYMRLQREPNDPHITLLRGVRPTDSAIAISTYESFHSGKAVLGDAASGKSRNSSSVAWEQALASNFTEFTFNGRHLRCNKTYQSKRTGLRIRSSKYLEWQLRDVTSAATDAFKEAKNDAGHSPGTVGTLLGRLSLEAAAKGVASKAVKGMDSDELGELEWMEPLDQDTQDLAVVILLALCHRDQAIQNRDKLGPHIVLDLPKRQMAYGLGMAAGTGLAAGAVFGAGAGGYYGGCGGVGADCGAGGGGGGGGF